MAKVALTTLGCKVNQFETETMEGLFRARGYEVVAFEDAADVYVINTCSVTSLGDKKSRQMIRRAIRQNEAAIVAVCGCYSQVAPEEIRAIEGVRVVLGTKERARIVDYVERAARDGGRVDGVGDVKEARVFEEIPLYDAPQRTRAFLKIEDGCQNFCSFCIIPYARGPVKSRALESVAREAEKLAAAGFREIVLTGIHLGAYGEDLTERITLADACRAALSAQGIERLRLGSLESVELTAELFSLMRADRRFCNHLHLPLQAGTDKILRAMNRHYTRDEFAALIARVRRELPGVSITTDMIVGFPGETEEDFEEGLAFARSLGFSRMHIFPYSRRTGTPAATLPDQVEEQEKKRRVHRMQEMADMEARIYAESFLGQRVKVLFETEREGEADGMTENYLRVYTQGARPGEMREVTLTRAYRDGLWGSLREDS